MNRNDLLLRLRALFLKNRVEKDLDDELNFHLEMQARKNLTAGMTAAEAKRRARIQFGIGDGVKERCRDARRIGFIETLFQDIGYAVRGFRRTPLFALTVVGTIALGLGWNTAVFTIFNAYVLRPLAVLDPYSLYLASWTDRSGRDHLFTWQQYQELSQHNPVFAQTSAMEGNVRTRMEGRPVRGQFVSGDFFETLGLNAAMGRMLLPQDSQSPDAEPVVVLSYAAWQNQFGSAPGIIGRGVFLYGRSFTVVGVAPEDFSSVSTVPTDFWTPITSAQIEESGNLLSPAQAARFAIVGRLRPGMDVRQAQAILTAAVQRITADRPESERATGAALSSAATLIPLKDILEAFLPIALAFLLVLLSACANVANMMLARAMSRQREIGIRLSLGAARGRLIRQLLTESVLLAVPAAAAGLAVSQALIEIGTRLLFGTIPGEFVENLRLEPLQPDVRVFGFMIGAAVASALLFGLAPAMQATRLNVMQAARGDFSSEFRPSRLRNALVVAQVTVCAFLLICSGVLLRGANHLQTFKTGLRTRDVIEVEIQDRSRMRVLAKLAAEPGIERVSATSDPPLNHIFPIVSASADNAAQVIRAPYSYASPEYFDLFEIGILRGRDFTAEEAISGASVAIVSDAAAQRLWPGQDPLGQSLHLAPDTHASREGQLSHFRTLRVVGIARNAAGGVLIGNPDRTCLYFPTNLQAGGNTLLMRVRGEPEAARQRLNVVLEDGDPGAIVQIHKLDEFVAGRLYPFRVAYWVSAAIGAIALLLTLSGVYGVLSYVVGQWTKEIGIRIAMGASTRSVVGLVLKQCTKLTVRGVALGAALALGASKLFSAQVVINPFDGFAYLGGIVLVLAACICAAYFPARRAARVDPISTLRYD